MSAEGVLQWTDEQYQSYLTVNSSSKVAPSNIEQTTASNDKEQTTASNNIKQATASNAKQGKVSGFNNIAHQSRGPNSMTSENAQNGISTPVLTNSTNSYSSQNSVGPGKGDRTQPGSNSVPQNPNQSVPGKKRKLPDWMLDSSKRNQVMKSRMKNNSLFK